MCNMPDIIIKSMELTAWIFSVYILYGTLVIADDFYNERYENRTSETTTNSSDF